jgi:hypothetical protein
MPLIGKSDDGAEQVREVCGVRSEGYRMVCELTKGHIKVLTDWHEAHARIDEHIATNIVDVTVVRTEHVKWAPNIFELAPEARKTPTPRAD